MKLYLDERQHKGDMPQLTFTPPALERPYRVQTDDDPILITDVGVDWSDFRRSYNTLIIDEDVVAEHWLANLCYAHA